MNALASHRGCPPILFPQRRVRPAPRARYGSPSSTVAVVPLAICCIGVCGVMAFPPQRATGATPAGAGGCTYVPCSAVRAAVSSLNCSAVAGDTMFISPNAIAVYFQLLALIWR